MKNPAELYTLKSKKTAQTMGSTSLGCGNGAMAQYFKEYNYIGLEKWTPKTEQCVSVNSA